jgi:hypothetical protein
MLRRACRVSLDFATATKRHEISRLLEAYRGAVNFYIRSLWQTPGSLNGATLARLPTEHSRLLSMHKDQALCQALTIVSSTRKAAKVTGIDPSRPQFKGMAVLCHGVNVEAKRGSFDLIVRLSTLRRGQRITIPTRKTVVLNKWLAVPGARLFQGCALSEKAIVVWVEFPEPEARKDNDVIAVDVGINKLIATSDGKFIGKDWREISANVCCCRPVNKGKRCARIMRDHYINRMVKRLPWRRMSAIVFEDLLNLKRGKQKKRGKGFRKVAAPWTYRRVKHRIDSWHQRTVFGWLPSICEAPPGHVPECGEDDRRNRNGETFRCVSCDHTADANFVGARNIRYRAVAALGGILSPGLQTSKIR